MSMRELEVSATFDSTEMTRSGTKLLNLWFSWIMDDSNGDSEDIDVLFGEFDLSFDDYFIDRDTDIDWEQIPEARVEGNKIVVTLDSKTGIDTVRQLLEDMGGHEIYVSGEDD